MHTLRFPKFLFLLFTCILLFVYLCSTAFADVYDESVSSNNINDLCSIVLDNENYKIRYTRDEVWTSTVAVHNGKGFTISLPDGLPSPSLFLRWHSAPVSYTICQYDASENLLASVTDDIAMLEQRYILNPGCKTVKMTIEGNGSLSELYVYGQEQDVPTAAQVWSSPKEKADLLMVVAHPDDEIVMMGGLLPTYAGEEGLQVQVVYMKANAKIRQYEALQGLKANHVSRCPLFLNVYDSNEKAVDSVIRLVRLIRQIQPEVIVTHDFNGEYNKLAHKQTAASVSVAVEYAADPHYDPESALEFGPWKTKKFYVHLYPENQLKLDLDTPLPSFGGKTAFEAAQESYSCHKSQRDKWLDIMTSNEYDCRLYGLVSSTVGPDIEKNSLFENIPSAGTVE